MVACDDSEVVCETVGEDFEPVDEVKWSEVESLVVEEKSWNVSTLCDFDDVWDATTETKVGMGGEEVVSPVGDSSCTHS